MSRERYLNFVSFNDGFDDYSCYSKELIRGTSLNILEEGETCHVEMWDGFRWKEYIDDNG